MPEETGNIRIKVKSGDSEAEVEASLSEIREAIELIPLVLSRLPTPGGEASQSQPMQIEAIAPRPGEPTSAAPPVAGSSTPNVTIEKGDSLSDVITKFFSEPWGRSPRKLMEVREVLQSYGLNYPKQSVAVALLRLAKGSRIRRFKGESGEYVYTASTGAVRIQGPVQPAVAQVNAEEVAHGELEPVDDQEEQLNLDAPPTH